eukprot:gene6394-6626_t
MAGDRFREIYYWDSYWVIRGLLVSKMTDSAKRLVLNLLSMLERTGFVPNGARVYYLNRSQPPLLSAMVKAVYEAQPDDLDLLRKASVKYYANWTKPRPESYREDAALALNVTGTSSPTNAAAAQLYRDLASGAESGWDFSSRWFADGRSISTIRTTQFERAAAQRAAAINALLWDDAAAVQADECLSVNQRVFLTTGFMHEKYDVTAADGGIGGGGEYKPQVGFGWSNGVVLDFLAHYV